MADRSVGLQGDILANYSNKVNFFAIDRTGPACAGQNPRRLQENRPAFRGRTRRSADALNYGQEFGGKSTAAFNSCSATHISVKGECKYWSRAVDKAGRNVGVLLTAKRDRSAAARCLCKVIDQRGTAYKITITIDKTGSNTAAID